MLGGGFQAAACSSVAHGLAVPEADALDHLGEPLRAVQPAPVGSAALASL